MAQEIEIEFKNLLTEQEYKKLLDFFKLDPSQGIVQTNHYFETKDFQLKSKSSALRIREKDNLFQLTLKEPHPEGLLETHDPLTKAEAKSWIDGEIIPKPHVANQLNQLSIDFAKLRYGGALSTRRIETVYKETVIVLDYSTYNGNTDYELEIEAKDKLHGEAVFNEIINELAITKKETPNKIERFYKSL